LRFLFYAYPPEESKSGPGFAARVIDLAGRGNEAAVSHQEPPPWLPLIAPGSGQRVGNGGQH
jgi:hypothetical protein